MNEPCRCEEGEFKLWFAMSKTTERFGVEIKGRTINEILSSPNGLAALLDIAKWDKLATYFPAADLQLKKFLAVPRIAQLVALHKEHRKDLAIQRNRRKADDDLFAREVQDRNTERGLV